MKNSHIGITLIFTSGNKAIQSSYIMMKMELEDLLNEVEKIANKQSTLNGYKYLGISDLYITESEANEAYLGRTSYYDEKTKIESKRHVLSNSKLKLALSECEGFRKSNISFVYFNDDREGDDFNSSIIIYSQICKYDSTEYLHNLAKSRQFKDKIIKFSVEELYLDSLEFVGVADLYGVSGDGLFQRMTTFEEIMEIKDEILGKNQIRLKLEEIEEDMSYIWD